MSGEGPTDVDAGRCIDFEEMQKCVGNSDWIIVDVRGEQETKDEGTIQGTVNIPLAKIGDVFGSDDGAAGVSDKCGRDVAQDGSNLIFHCKKGGRATKAALEADKFGFVKSRVYKGSLEDWIANGGTVCKEFCPF